MMYSMNIASRSVAIFSVMLLIASCAALGRSGAGRQFDEGLALFNRGQYDDAIPHFEKATELDPDYTQAYLYLGRSYLNLRRWSQAIPPLRTAYRLSPGDTRKEITNILIDALLGSAISEFSRGNLNTSRTLLREALSLNPSNTRAQSLLRDILEQ